MIKSSSRLYDHLVRERHNSLIASTQFLKIRSHWLHKFKRRSLFHSMEAWMDFNTKWQILNIEDSLTLQHDVEYLAGRFALAEWQILWTLFIKGYKPESGQSEFFPRDLRHPKAYITVGAMPNLTLEDLTRALSTTNIQLILDPSVNDIGNQSSKILANINLDLPIEIPIRYAIDLVRECRSQSNSILREISPEILDSSVQDGSSSFLICSGNNPEFVKTVQSITDNLGIELISRFNSSDRLELASNPFSSLRIGIQFSPSAPSADVIRNTKAGIYSGRKVSELLGVTIGKRVRFSPMTDLASSLQVNGEHLSNRGIGDLILEQLGQFPKEVGKESSKVIALKSTVKSRRNQILQRFRRKGLFD